MRVLGMGHDVVDIRAFEALLEAPGSRMSHAFSARELRQSAMRADDKHDGRPAHLAVRWAGKEAVLKAWCEALGALAYPYTLDDMPWAQIEILDDARGCPHVVLSAEVEAQWERSTAASHASIDERKATASAMAESVRANAEHLGDAVGSQAANAGRPIRPTRPAGFAGAAGAAGSAGDGASLRAEWHVSLSHDGDMASAVVLVQGD